MRKAKPKKRQILPDPKFNDQKVSKFVNHLMYDGKKNISYEIFYAALDVVGEKMKNEEKPALDIWKEALDKITPQVEVKSRRIGGATYPVPVEIRPGRQLALALRWMAQYASARRGVPMPRAVALELIDAYNNTGNVLKKRDDTHKMAQANRAFAHYAF